MSVVCFERHGRVGLILVNNPPVNAISHAVRAGIVACLDLATKDKDAQALVLAATGRTFMAGADITEFGKPPLAPFFADVIAALEASDKPVIAAIHGKALGGGLELALACHYRMARADAALGLPEVNLGIIPGAEGTQRLPRLVGLETALDMITSGRPVSAAAAYDTGVLDAVVPVDAGLIEEALAYGERLIDEKAPPRRLSMTTIEPDGNETALFAEWREKVAKSARGVKAPLRAIDAVEAAFTLPFAEGVKRERAIFAECSSDPQSKALQHAFFAERKAARLPDIGKDIKPRPFAHIGIVGGGTMGCGIALACAAAGLSITLIEQSDEAAERASGTITSILDASRARGRINDATHQKQKNVITIRTNMEALKDADLIIEAVFENLEVKKSVFRTLDAVAKKGAILATNTSYLDVDDIAATTSRPADVLGLHFFSPAHIMKLLEIVRGRETAPDVLATAMAFGKAIRKVAVVARVCYGFIGNRMLEGYVREAGLLMLEGAKPEQIDAAIRAFGYPMGPLQMLDLAGLDIGHMLRSQFPPERFDPDAYRVISRLVEQGRKGQKTRAGIYRYEKGSRAPIPDPLTTDIIGEEAEKAGIKPRTITDEEIVERCILPLINEGARILEEGVAIRASDIDVVYLYGYGFPRWRGGPMFYASQQGLAHVHDRILHYQDQQGPRWWTPAPLIKKLAKENKAFDA